MKLTLSGKLLINLFTFRMSYYPGKGLKKIGKGMKKLNVFQGLAKTKDKEDPLKGRVYVLDKPSKDNNVDK